MIRQRIVQSLRDLAASLKDKSEGSRWYLFGSVDQNEPNAEDIDLMVICTSDEQADILRRAIDPDALELPMHLAFFTFEEANDIQAVEIQYSHQIYP